MSNPVGAQRYGLGGGDAYYDAVKYGGYTGTREQFGRDQAEFAENATAVAEAREEVEHNTQTVVNTAQTFTEETVPAAIQSVEEKGDTEEDRLELRTTELVEAVNTAGAVQVQAVRDEGTTQTGLVSGAGTAQIEAVEQAGSDQVDAVELAGSTQVGNVNGAGTTQVGNVNQAGTTQVGNVNTAGAAQVQAVEDKGEEVLNSIPADYSDLIEDVDNLKESINEVTETVIVANPTATYRLAIDPTTVKITSTNVASNRTVFVPVEHGKNYRIVCPVSSNKRVGLCNNTTVGTSVSSYSQISGNLDTIISNTNNEYIVIQFFTNTDAIQDVNTYLANLAIYCGLTAVDAISRTEATEAENIAVNSYIISNAVGNIVHIENGAKNVPVKEITFNIEVISGVSSARITQCGKNLLPSDGWALGSIGAYQGKITTTSSSTRKRIMDVLLPAGTYVMSSGDAETSSIWYFYGADGTVDDTLTVYSATSFPIVRTLTTPMFMATTSAILDDSARKRQIELGQISTEYEAPTINVYNFALPASVGSVTSGVVFYTRDDGWTIDVSSVKTHIDSSITLKTFEGINNIYTNTGNFTKFEYCVNPPIIVDDEVFYTENLYGLPILNAFTDITIDTTAYADSTEFHELCRTLCENSNGYLTQTLMGQDAHGNNLYYYKTHPTVLYYRAKRSTTFPIYPIEGGKALNTFRIIYTTNIHADEHNGNWVIYNLLYKIINACDTDMLSFFKNNVEIIWIPYITPTGTYGNIDGQNVNRSFPTTKNGVCTSPEATLVKEVFDEYGEGTDLHIDVHTFPNGTVNSQYFATWIFTNSDKLGKRAVRTTEDVLQKYRAKYPSVTQFAKGTGAFNNIPSTSSSYMQTVYNVPSGTIEAEAIVGGNPENTDPHTSATAYLYDFITQCTISMLR